MLEMLLFYIKRFRRATVDLFERADFERKVLIVRGRVGKGAMVQCLHIPQLHTKVLAQKDFFLNFPITVGKSVFASGNLFFEPEFS